MSASSRGRAVLDRDLLVKSSEATFDRNTTDPIGHSDGYHNNDGEMTREQWLTENIPFIDTPDTLLNRIYYFRWNNLLSCLGKRAEDGKYELNESSEKGWYHKYIDCAQGAHLRDARWIKDGRYMSDYVDVTPDKEGYWGYFIHSVLEKYYLDGDKTVLERNYEKLKARLSSRDGKYDSEMGLYFLENGTEGQEAGVNGFDRIERGMTYRASFVSEGSSLDALRDNFTEGAYWSAEGCEDENVSVEVDVGTENNLYTGVRLYFRSGKQIPSVEIMTKSGEWKTVTSPFIKEDRFGMTELSFDGIEGDTMRLVFGNKPEAVSLYELVPTYTFEPWGCGSFWKLIGGDESYRICANSFMAAGMTAVSEIAQLLGKSDEAEHYRRASKSLTKSIFDNLWDGEQSCFFELTKEKRRVVGKESNFYTPWAFGLVPDTEDYSSAWKYLMDEDVFLEEFGITTLEKKSPHHMQSFGHACLWNGPVWPYTFSLVLTAMAEHLRMETASEVSKEDYFELIKRFCKCHFDNGSDTVLALREDHHPSENKWIAQCPDYNHSTFIDNVLCGLIGIRPKKNGLEIDPIVPDGWEYFCVENVNWRGNDVTVIYDKTGERYGLGKGYKVIVGGEVVHESAAPERCFIYAR